MTATSTPPFGTVLIANRGEIACRILRTLRTLGIRSVAVYSDADRDAKHVTDADTAVRIGPASAAQSYLDIDAVIRAAKASGADAIHPGYGFLSENADFARACAEAGIVFIGPGADALEVMGDKIRSKNHVGSRGVPVIPGDSRPGLSNADLAEAAIAVGYPLLIKPSAGGGGKGMHAVHDPADLEAALVTARRVAAAAFGDDALFLERLIPSPRHIEVQLLADNAGSVIHLGERECSLQRRHQKVIEEAPSPLLDADTRARIGEAACRVADSVGYVGAGTVEFLVSAERPDEFFFMEMNTRLQVEHPVTEEVTGLDLVAEQIRIAAGQPLPLAQDDVVLTGHAIEARVYAENPERGFLPATGTVMGLREAEGDGIRVDSSLREGLVIGSDYDPMLAKVIAHGADRGEALRRLDRALAETTVFGVRTNIEYLRLLLADDDVRAGALDTSLIDRRLPELEFRRADDELLAAAALLLHAERETASTGSPWSRPSGWRLGGPRPTAYAFALDGDETATVTVLGGAHAASVRVRDGDEHPASLRAVDGMNFAVSWGGGTRMLRLAHAGTSVWVSDRGFTVELPVLSREQRLAARLARISRADSPHSPEVRSPMPGTVISVDVETGSTVAAGSTLVVVEAMKMEHKLTASVAGEVTVHVAPGDLVKLDQLVATLVPTDQPHDGPDLPTVEGDSE